MVRSTDKWTKGDVIHYFWITGALLSVIIFLNTTHVLISKNSDFCEAEEDVDDFLMRNDLHGLPRSTVSLKGESMQVKNSPTPNPSSGNIESGKSPVNQTENTDIGSSGDKTGSDPDVTVEEAKSNSKKLSTRRTTSTATASTKTTSTTSTTTKIHFMDKLTTGNGRWRQVKTVGIDNFLKAEGGNWIYRTAASSAIPDFIYTKKGENHYEQRVEVSVFPSQVNQIYFDKEYTFIDQFGDLVTCKAKNFGDYTESVTTGGGGGKMRTFMQIVNNQLFLTTILEDKNNVKAVRIFEKQ